MWVSINQSGKTLKKWVLRYTDAAGKRQKFRIGSYPEMTLAKTAQRICSIIINVFEYADLIGFMENPVIINR